MRVRFVRRLLGLLCFARLVGAGKRWGWVAATGVVARGRALWLAGDLLSAVVGWPPHV